jgi:hypothetical protein
VWNVLCVQDALDCPTTRVVTFKYLTHSLPIDHRTRRPRSALALAAAVIPPAVSILGTHHSFRVDVLVHSCFTKLVAKARFGACPSTKGCAREEDLHARHRRPQARATDARDGRVTTDMRPNRCIQRGSSCTHSTFRHMAGEVRRWSHGSHKSPPPHPFGFLGLSAPILIHPDTDNTPRYQSYAPPAAPGSSSPTPPRSAAAGPCARACRHLPRTPSWRARTPTTRVLLAE